MSLKIISFCVYGDAPRYIQGAVENARLWPTVYPDWHMRVYLEQGLDGTELERLGVHVVRMGPSLGASGMFWRLLAIWDAPAASHIIFRDADSRLNVREAAAVKAWLDSGKTAHSMHDHPYHRSVPIMGGMWGIKELAIPIALYGAVTTRCGQSASYMDDQRFMESAIYPHVSRSLLTHSSIVPLQWSAEPFPAHPPYDGFVGQIYGDDGKPVWPKVAA
jgi:hypothetical protein